MEAGRSHESGTQKPVDDFDPVASHYYYQTVGGYRNELCILENRKE
jgi:hypothetical protein